MTKAVKIGIISLDEKGRIVISIPDLDEGGYHDLVVLELKTELRKD